MKEAYGQEEKLVDRKQKDHQQRNQQLVELYEMARYSEQEIEDNQIQKL